MGELLGLGAKSGCNNMICIFFFFFFFFFFSEKKYKKMHEIESFICNNAAHDVILCNLGY